MSKKLYNQTVTAYIPYRQGLTTNHTFVRVVINGVHWEENSIMVFRETGTNVSSNVEIYFPRGKDKSIPKQITPGEWAQLPFDDIEFLERHYAFALTGVVDVIWTQPRLFREIIDYRFDWATSAVTTTNMNNLSREYGGITLRDINYNWYGDRKLHHIAVR